jgi:protoporphyrinogen oxidase
VIHAQTFRYPKLGSGEFSRRLAELAMQNGGKIQYGSPIVRICVKSGSVSELHTGDRQIIPVSPDVAVVTTVPVGYLASLVEPAPPPNVLQAARDLVARHLVLLYVLLDKPSVSDDMWLFFPETKYIFTRVFEQKNFSPYMTPKDKTCLCLEIVVSDPKLWKADDVTLFESAIAGLEETGLAQRSQVIEYFTRRNKWTYPVYDLGYKQNTATALNYLDSISNLYSVGRQGGFNYVGQIDCLDIGVVTAEHILKWPDKSRWAEARQRFASYIVLD